MSVLVVSRPSWGESEEHATTSCWCLIEIISLVSFVMPIGFSRRSLTLAVPIFTHVYEAPVLTSLSQAR